MIKNHQEQIDYANDMAKSFLQRSADIGIDLALRRIISEAYIQGANDAYNSDAASRLSEAERKSGWIDVKDELPPLDEQVFALYRWGEEMQWLDTCIARMEEHSTGHRFWNVTGFFNGGYDVIAWHPLPDIPKET